MRIGNIIGGLWVLLALSACTSVQYMSIDSLVPADVSFAHSVRNVAVVNNVVPGTVKTHQAVTVGEEMPGSGRVVAETLAKHIADARYFDRVILSDSTLRKSSDRYQQISLSPQEAGRLLADLGADMLISVDRIAFKNRQEIAQDNGEIVPGVVTRVDVVTRLYLPGRQRPFQAFHDTDSLIHPLDGLTDLYLAKLVSEVAAQLPLKHILPQWRQDDRFYYVGGAYEMRDAAAAVREGDWDLAKDSWQQIYDRNKGGKNRMRAAFNLALYYEMQGDLKTACRYMDEAAAIMGIGSDSPGMKVFYDPADDRRLVRAYRRDLVEKMASQDKLDLQMNRFEEEK